MKRREFLKNTGLLVTVPALLGGLGTGRARAQAAVQHGKMLILGFDGMDPTIVRAMIKKGELPNLRKFLEKGCTFSDMLSTAPPESPCAWASFATGLDPAGHGLFGFLTRDPKTYAPYSNAEPVKVSDSTTVSLFKYKIPIIGGESRLNREGKPFWDYLMERDIESTIFKMPSNYPPSKMTCGRAVSGMGTPDITGAQGTFILFTSDETEAMRDVPGKGRINYAYFDENEMMEGEIQGPANDLVQKPEPVMASFKVFRDKPNRTIRIDIQGQEVLLQEGQISEWITIKFELIPLLQSISANVRFYLLDNSGDKFRLYITPPNIAPSDPAQEICHPENYGKELVEHVGSFYTLGLPADFNAIRTEIFNMENYIVQSETVFKESVKLFDYEFERFLGQKQSMLFYYFSAIDQGSHIYWALRDPQHPNYKPEEAQLYGDQVEQMYRQFDAIVGDVLKKLPPGIPLMILSDHGFAPLRRQVNLNALLFQEGFLKINGDPDYDDSYVLLTQGKWGETKAYALGLNGIFINLKDREGQGIVAPGDKRQVMEDIQKMLLAAKDPVTGENPIGKVFISEDVYRGQFLDRGPDLIIGCNYGYGLDYSCATGGLGAQAVTANMSRWSGDHIIDPHQVPALLLANFPMNIEKTPAIWDLAPTILQIFGIPTPADMRGKSLLA